MFLELKDWQDRSTSGNPAAVRCSSPVMAEELILSQSSHKSLCILYPVSMGRFSTYI